MAKVMRFKTKKTCIMLERVLRFAANMNVKSYRIKLKQVAQDGMAIRTKEQMKPLLECHGSQLLRSTNVDDCHFLGRMSAHLWHIGIVTVL